MTLGFIFVLLVSCLTGLSQNPVNNHLKIAVLGDSMSWIGGNNCENPKGWTCHFKQKFNPDTIFLYARSGATWTNTSNTKEDLDYYTEILDDRNVIYNQVKRLERDVKEEGIQPDIIIIYAGANDAWFENKRPDCFQGTLEMIQEVSPGDDPSQRRSLIESMAQNIKLINEFLPSSSVLLVTPVEMSKVSAEKIHKVSSVIEDVGREMGVKVIRADRGVPIKHAQEKQKHRYTTDGAHTNEAGALLIADFIGEGVSEMTNAH